MYRDKSTMYDIKMLNSSGSNSRCAWDWYKLRIYKTKKFIKNRHSQLYEEIATSFTQNWQNKQTICIDLRNMICISLTFIICPSVQTSILNINTLILIIFKSLCLVG